MSREFLITHAWILAVVFILLLAGVVFVRHKLGSGVEIKATDAGIAAIALVLLVAAAGIFKNVALPMLDISRKLEKTGETAAWD